jgi:hypothetical protein
VKFLFALDDFELFFCGGSDFSAPAGSALLNEYCEV